MSADIPAVEQCHSCGALLTPAATWCGQCYAPRGATPAGSPATLGSGIPAQSGELSIMSGNRQQVAARPATPMIKTRWRKTPTTFGPVGRVVFTFLLFVPVPLLIVGVVVTGGLEIIGAGIWILVIMPWALRDIWKAGQLPAG
jgi:hypothetical protein